jgi:glycosyltransferase involved in cell wall biosynthesis
VRVAYTLEQCWHRVPGGTAVAALEVARALAHRPGLELVGVAARHGGSPLPAFAPPIPVRTLPVLGRLVYQTWAYARWPAVERATGPVDLVHATTVMVPPCRAPLVVTVHDLAFLHEPEHFTVNGNRLFRRFLDEARRRAALVLCSSLATLEDAASAGLPAHRLRHVPLGVTAVAAGPDEVAAARARFELPDPYLAFAGTIEPRKNLPGLLAAYRRVLAKVPDLHLVLIGPAGWGPNLAPAAAGLEDRVHLVGFVSEADKRALLAGAAALAYPSLREGFGLPVLEAMVQGTPVVTSRGTSTEEVAGGAAVLVDPLDVDDIARGILEALGRHAELAARGRARAAAATWAATAERTVEAYREVVG